MYIHSCWKNRCYCKEFDNLKLENLSFAHKNLFDLIEEKDFREDVSSTEKRRQDN